MKFYRQQLLRLAKLAVTLIILSVTATAISSVLTARGCIVTDMTGTQQFRQVAKIPGVEEYASMLIYFSIASGLALALYGFSFLNKRSESDFYLSLPIRRSRIFIAVTLAGVSWILIGIVANVFVSLAIFGLHGIALIPSYPLLLIGAYLTLALLIFAAAALASTLTGTWMSTFVAAVVILLLPRTILYLLGQMIVSQTQLIRLQGFGILLNPMYNIFTAAIGKMANYQKLGDVLTFVPGILYSFVLALAELLLAGFLFCKRPSETTGQSTACRALQNIFACGLALLAMSPILYWSPFMNQNWSKRNALIFMALAVAVYLVCQMVQKKSVKHALFSLPWMAAPIALLAVLIGAARFGADQILRDVPAADTIDYVTFNYGDQNLKYQTDTLEKVRFAEDASKEMIVKALADSTDMVRYYESIDGEYYLSYGPSVDIHLKNGRILKRALPMMAEDELYTIRQNNADYRKALSAMPDDAATLNITARTDYGAVLPTEQAQALLDVYQEEVAALEERGLRVYDNWGQQFGWLTVYARHGSKLTCNEYYITEQTPQTASLYLNLYNAYCGEADLSLAEGWLQQIDAHCSKNIQGDRFSCALEAYNCTLPPDRTLTDYSYSSTCSASWEWYPGSGEMSAEINAEIREILEILRRGKPAEDATQFCVRAVCGAELTNDTTNDYNIGYGVTWNTMQNAQPYLAFSTEDAMRLQKLIYNCRIRNDSTLQTQYETAEKPA